MKMTVMPMTLSVVDPNTGSSEESVVVDEQVALFFAWVPVVEKITGANAGAGRGGVVVLDVLSERLVVRGVENQRLHV
tara:strand:- start:568 stop:801 length:234 start_codon:yes stop_codon:yes gene_type:complete